MCVFIYLCYYVIIIYAINICVVSVDGDVGVVVCFVVVYVCFGLLFCDFIFCYYFIIQKQNTFFNLLNM